jgi:hypothetical protein
MFQLFTRYNIPGGAQYCKIKMNPDPNLPEVRHWGFSKWRDIRVKEMEYNGMTILKVKGKKICGYYFPDQKQSRFVREFIPASSKD